MMLECPGDPRSLLAVEEERDKIKMLVVEEEKHKLELELIFALEQRGMKRLVVSVHIYFRRQEMCAEHGVARHRVIKKG